MAFDMSFNTTPSYKRNKELYDTIIEIISPIKNYFKNGIEVVYTLEEAKYLFNKMNADARSLSASIQLDTENSKYHLF
jgi:hypothetical protein